MLALFQVDKLATDARTDPELGRGGIRLSVILQVEGPEQVDQLADRPREAGGNLTKEPVDAEFFEGRDAYFSDPGRQFWEMARAASDNHVGAAVRRAAGLPPG